MTFTSTIVRTIARPPEVAVRRSEERIPARSTRPLLVRFGALGDMVLILSLVRALHERFGEPIDIVTSGAVNLALVRDQPGVGTVHLIRSRKTPYWLSPDQRRLTAELRRRGLSPTWNCDGDAPSRRLLAQARIPASFIIDAAAHPRFPEEHEVDRWLRLAELTPEALRPHTAPAPPRAALRAPPLLLAPERLDEAQRWLQARGLANVPFILIQAGNKRTTKWWRPRDRKSNTKYWPEERWAQVIDVIAVTRPEVHFFLCGVSSEMRLNETIRSHVCAAGRVHNCAGDLPLHRLLALQALAEGMLSVDTGPAHAAAAMNCPLVVLFGVHEPAMYLPRGAAPVKYVRGFDSGRPSMRAITASQVIDAWTAVQERRHSRGVANGRPRSPEAASDDELAGLARAM